ncbi:MAG: hypothetical protein RSF40_01540 [Oscillospiraceae bacterium]
MKTIKSKVIEKLTWCINSKRTLTQPEVEFVEQFNPTIYHNDLTCTLWAFDTKLPSGAWLENMEFNNELTMCKALVLEV